MTRDQIIEQVKSLMHVGDRSNLSPADDALLGDIATTIVDMVAGEVEALQAENERLREATEAAAKIAEVWLRRAMHLSPYGYEIEREHGHMAAACAKEILALTDPAEQEN